MHDIYHFHRPLPSLKLACPPTPLQCQEPVRRAKRHSQFVRIINTTTVTGTFGGCLTATYILHWRLCRANPQFDILSDSPHGAYPIVLLSFSHDAWVCRLRGAGRQVNNKRIDQKPMVPQPVSVATGSYSTLQRLQLSSRVRTMGMGSTISHFNNPNQLPPARQRHSYNQSSARLLFRPLVCKS